MTKPSIEERVASSELFAGLPPDVVRALAEHATVRRAAEGEVIFHYGDPANTFYLVLGGRVSVEVAAIEGPALVLQQPSPGAVLGWSWLIAPHVWSFQARAETDAELIEFDGVALRARCEQSPEFGYPLLKRISALMSERLLAARRKMMDAWRPAGFA